MAANARMLKAIVESALGTELNTPGDEDPGVPCLLGIACWVWAVLASFFGSAITVTGFVIQKQASKSPGKRIGDISLNAKWLSGFLFATLLPVPLQVWTYCHAPMSLTTPLSGVSVLFNMVLAPFMLGERLQRWPDVPAASCILLGTVLTTLSGSHEEQSFDIGDLTELLSGAVFIAALLPLVGAVVACIGYMERRSAQIELAALQRPTNPNILEVVLPAIVAAGCGCIANIALKGVGELAKDGGASFLSFLMWLLLAGLPALGQINYVNRGLRLYVQSVFFPVYSALLVLANTFYGLIFYREYNEMVESGLFVFFLGMFCILLGVVLFAFRKSESGRDMASLATELAGEMSPPRPKRTVSGVVEEGGIDIAPSSPIVASGSQSPLSPPSWRIMTDA